ncbi:alkanesulfonate monooxygenase SsuD/methylene tetrahydromethanopterin reductase-like flavin-dependent oxidoreductase (luciferase family) [Halarchaeum rubridurum]|uniref:Alkanesulfonate monooxygenase SsuD/methylene tetrahydromethanopterin reductase-like flavin-dependent oxidoreductase (Luciferase family) n=1 Tax=Halarchaeum rubridurum TaxID=489911 RepID=A0A830FZS4_9EURY|nr:LLM class flavin-dependent oxidoreductase [Halarchaeum rubridurum]MBP1955195.1 alkanesulfonate monooxygenase SsuD/methylene tetrahydromethanopterin reductase-like flavin-dependent oxidoreductase (luciferase family) [Halarchaeum rubridurum]GGM68224.1 LLM class F420-dependent oxidoreductase [Halarchaeum rubridurum]
MRFGYHNASFHYPDADDAFEGAMALARRLEGAGFEWVSVMDHLWQLPFVGVRDEPFFDAYTTLPALARETGSMDLSALVTSPHYRNPAMLGRQLATLDHASGGRAVLGIGAGWFEEEYDAYGFDFPEIPTRVHQLRDTVNLVRAMWTEESPVTFESDYHDVEELYLEPKPVQDGGPDVLVGGGGEDLTLKAVADLADRWNVPGVSPEAFAHKLDVLEGYCEDFGTDYDAIEKTVLQTVIVRDDEDDAHAVYEDLQNETAAADPTPRGEYRGLVGTPAQVKAGIERFEAEGAEMVMLRAERNDPETIDRLVEDVVPEMG